MSRTDRTRPAWVRVLDAFVEVHDHRDGVCDIEGVRPSRENVYWRPDKCHYDGDWSNPEAQLWCSCPYCSGKLYLDSRDRRLQRRQGKRLAREWWRED